MSAKKIRKDLEKAIERKAKLEAELATIQDGPRSKEDALQAVEAGFEAEIQGFRADMAATLGSQPMRWARSLEERETPMPALSVHLRDFTPSRFVADVVRRKNATITDPTALLPALALLVFPTLKVEIEKALEGMPRGAYGFSQCERDQREGELRRDIAKLEEQIERLRSAWTEEVGDGIPVPA